jgi:hypothetical protein
MRALLPVLALVASPALAAPEGAPWNQDGGPGRLDCTQCHFDGKAIRQSEAVHLDGLPAAVVAHETYELSLNIEYSDLITAGFLITAESGGRPAGAFQPIDTRTSANGAALRSTREGLRHGAPGSAKWTFRWTASASVDGPITFYVAANASNDDASAFGDQIFLSTFEAKTAKAP